MGEFVAQLSVMTIICSGLALVFGVVLIKQNKREQHMRAMLTASVLAVLFLIFYLTKLALGAERKYTGDYKLVYFTILISHIILAATNLPLALITLRNAWIGYKRTDGRLYRANSEGPRSYFENHKKWAKFTVPVWLYVAITGWIIYVMLHQA